MGTRNLTGIWIDGNFKVAQYGQWDGYPSSAGAEIADTLKLIMAEDGMVRLSDNVRRCVALSDKDVKAKYAEMGIEGDWITLGDAKRFKEAYPQLDRDMGRSIIRYVYEE